MPIFGVRMPWEEDPQATASGQEAGAIGALEAGTALQSPMYASNAAQYGHTAFSPTAAQGQYQYSPESEQAAAAAAAAGGWQSPYETNIQADPSQAAQAYSDPLAQAGQYSAMAGLGETYGGFQDIYQQGGMTAIDRARQEESKNRELGVARGQREALAQDMEMRGMSGSGTEMAQAMAAQEAATARQSATSLGTEAMALNRRDAALGAAGATAGQLGGLSSDVRGQSFGEAYQRGSAADQTSQFNAGMSADREARRAEYERGAIGRDTDRRQGADQGNVDWMRSAAGYDVAGQSDANRMNTDTDNARRLRNEGYQQDRNQFHERQAGAMANIYAGGPVYQASENAAGRQAQSISDIVGAGAKVGAAAL